MYMESMSTCRINYESTDLDEEWGVYLSEEELNSETVPERKFALSNNEDLWYILEDSFGIIQKKSFKEEIIVRRYRQEENVKVNKLNSETVLQRINNVDFDRDVKVGSKVKTVGRQAEFSPMKNKVEARKMKPQLKKEDINILPGNSLRKWLLGGTK